MYKTMIISLLLIYVMSSCSNPSESDDEAPADHTVNISGTRHKSGLNDPLSNCVSCHGPDLQGGRSGVSCYECHGQKW